MGSAGVGSKHPGLRLQVLPAPPGCRIRELFFKTPSSVVTILPHHIQEGPWDAGVPLGNHSGVGDFTLGIRSWKEVSKESP